MAFLKLASRHLFFSRPSLASSPALGDDAGMPALTRRRDPEAREDCWNIYYGDVRAGTIALRTGIPHDEDPWGWICGFYPGSRPGEHTDGTAPTFDQARADFEQAWRVFLTKRTEADFQAWRDQRDWTAWKYAMHDVGLPLPTRARVERAASAARRSISRGPHCTSAKSI